MPEVTLRGRWRGHGAGERIEVTPMVAEALGNLGLATVVSPQQKAVSTPNKEDRAVKRPARDRSV